MKNEKSGTTSLFYWMPRNTVNVFSLEPGLFLPWKKQFLVHLCHTVQRKDLQSSFLSRHVEMLSLLGVPICLVLPGSIAQASKGYFKSLDYHGGFPLSSMMSLFTPLRKGHFERPMTALGRLGRQPP